MVGSQAQLTDAKPGGGGGERKTDVEGRGMEVDIAQFAEAAI